MTDQSARETLLQAIEAIIHKRVTPEQDRNFIERFWLNGVFEASAEIADLLTIPPQATKLPLPEAYGYVVVNKHGEPSYFTPRDRAKAEKAFMDYGSALIPVYRKHEAASAAPSQQDAASSMPVWQQLQFGMLLGKLSDWCNEDHADAITLCRSDMIAIIEGVKDLKRCPAARLTAKEAIEIGSKIADDLDTCLQEMAKNFYPTIPLADLAKLIHGNKVWLAAQIMKAMQAAEVRFPAGKEPIPDWKQDQADTSVMPRKPLPAESVTEKEISDCLWASVLSLSDNQARNIARAILAKYEVRRRA